MSSSLPRLASCLDSATLGNIMKLTHDTNKFSPFDITFTFETVEEAQAMLALFGNITSDSRGVANSLPTTRVYEILRDALGTNTKSFHDLWEITDFNTILPKEQVK